MPRKKDRNRTVQTKYRFTIDELSLITEAIMMLQSGGARVGIGLGKEDGTLWSPTQLAMITEEEKQRMFDSGEIKIVPMAGQEITEKEQGMLDDLFNVFNHGLGMCEDKIEEADAKEAEENIDDVIKGFYDLLKEDK